MSRYYGVLLIVVLVAVSGVIAYVGDIVGRRMGRKRLSLFGLRPRHTAIVISVISGMLITVVTLAVAMALSENVRLGILRVGPLRAELRRLTKEVASGQQALEKTRTKLTRDLAATEGQLKQEQAKLSEAQKARQMAEGGLERTSKNLAGLTQRAAQLREENEKQGYLSEFMARRAGYQQVIFSANQPLDIVLITPGQTQPLIRKRLDSFIADLDAAVQKAGAKPERGEGPAVVIAQAWVRDPKTGESGWLPANQVLDGLAKSVRESTAPNGVIVEAICRTNSPPDAPVLVYFLIFRNDLVFAKGTVLGAITIREGTSEADTYALILHLLREQVGPKGQGRVMPLMNPSVPQNYNPAKSPVGELQPTELFDAIAKVQKTRGAARVTAVAKSDTWTTGPLQVELRVEGVGG